MLNEHADYDRKAFTNSVLLFNSLIPFLKIRKWNKSEKIKS